MSASVPDELGLLIEIRDLLVEIRDQGKPVHVVMPSAMPTTRPVKADRATPREHIIG